MKKIIALIMLVMLSLSIVAAEETPVLISAPEESTTPIQNKMRITPDHALWGVDKVIDDILINIQFNDYNRAQMALQIAQERQEEVQEMLDKKDTVSAEKAAKDWENKVKDAEDIRNKIHGQNKVEEEKTLDDNIRNRIEVLNRVKTKFEDSENPNDDHGLKGIENALQNIEKDRKEHKAEEESEDDSREDVGDDIPGNNGNHNGPGGSDDSPDSGDDSPDSGDDSP
jgi:hypothetical protein